MPSKRSSHTSARNERTFVIMFANQSEISPGLGNEGFSVEGSVDEGSVDEGSVDEGSVDEGSVDEGSVDEGSVDEGSVEDASVEDASVEDASVEDVSVEDASVEDVSVEDASVDEGAVVDSVTPVVSVVSLGSSSFAEINNFVPANNANTIVNTKTTERIFFLIFSPFFFLFF